MMRFGALLLGAIGAVSAHTIAEINGDKFVSPLKDQSVSNVTGLVTAKGPNGIWLRSTTPDDNPLTAEAIYVFGSTVGASLAVGDIIQVNGRVQEYRLVMQTAASIRPD
jgi:predicted extracellular nuclease